jgi:hypothetical protein
MMNALADVSPATLTIVVIAFMSGTLLNFALLGILYMYCRKTFSYHHENINIVREDLGALCNGSLGLGERLSNLESRFALLTQRQEHLELQEAPERSYKHAIKMVKRGADIEELMEDCGLARGEAELIVLSKQLDRAM